MKYFTRHSKTKKASTHINNSYDLRIKNKHASCLSHEKIELDLDGYKKLETIYKKKSNGIRFYSQKESISFLKRKNGPHPLKEHLNFFDSFENKIFISQVDALNAQEKIMGVFAKEPIGNPYRYKHCAIYQTEKIKSENTKSEEMYYTFTLNDEYDLSAEKKRTWPSLVNSASSKYFANLEAEIQNGEVVFKVIKPIQPNQQLLIWYGDTYSYPKGQKRFLTPDDTYLSVEERYQASKIFYEDTPLFDFELNSLLGYGPDTVFIAPKQAQRQSINMPYYAKKGEHFEAQQQNMTHLHLACWQGDVESVRKLQKFGANIHCQLLERGFTALHLLVLSQNKARVKFEIFDYILTEYDLVDLSLKDQEDHDVLTHIIMTNQLDLLKNLLDKYWSKLKKDRNESILYSLIKHGSTKCLNKVISQYFDNNAYKENKEELVELYLELQENQPMTEKTKKICKHLEEKLPEEIKACQTTDLMSQEETDQTESESIIAEEVIETLSTMLMNQEETDQTESESIIAEEVIKTQTKPTSNSIVFFNNVEKSPKKETFIKTTPPSSITIPPSLEHLRKEIEFIAFSFQSQNECAQDQSSLEDIKKLLSSRNEYTQDQFFLRYVISSKYGSVKISSKNEDAMTLRMIIIYFYISTRYGKNNTPNQNATNANRLMLIVVMTMPVYCINLEGALIEASQKHFGINLFPCFNSPIYRLSLQSKLAKIRENAETIYHNPLQVNLR